MRVIDSKLAEIRRANDILLGTRLTGNVMWRPAFAKLQRSVQQALLDQARLAPEYDVARDPKGEHAAGFARIDAHVLVWDILYYDGRRAGFQGRSPDPSDPYVTRRVLLLDYLSMP